MSQLFGYLEMQSMDCSECGKIFKNYEKKEIIELSFLSNKFTSTNVTELMARYFSYTEN